MVAPRRWRILCALLVGAVALSSAPPASAQETGGSSASDITSSFGIDGELGHVDSDSAGSMVDGSYSLGDIDPTTGDVIGGDATAYVTDQMALLSDLSQADQLSLDALRAAERARLEEQKKKRGKLPASVPYAAEFEAAGAKYGVDPALLAAVAQTESGFKPENIECRNRSSAGALGIMQFMPGTAAGFGIDPCDPAQAIDAGAKYLSGLYAKFGDWDLALAGYNWGPGNISKNGRANWPAETKNYVVKVNAAWESYKVDSQGEVGPEGCPTSAPAGTLRAGSESIGIYELCRRSVEQAATPEAAQAIIVALGSEFLGKPYSQPKRESAGWYDCSSYVTRAYTVAGTKLRGATSPTTDSLTNANYKWAERISYGSAKPGDLVLDPAPGHVGMLLADGWWVHTNRTGDVSHVKRAPTSPDLVLRVHPERV